MGHQLLPANRCPMFGAPDHAAALRSGRGGFLAMAPRDELLRRVRGADGVAGMTGLPSRLRRIRLVARRPFESAEEIAAVLLRSDDAL